MAWSKPDSSKFSQYLNLKDVKDALLGFEVIDFQKEHDRGSKYGPKDTVFANVTVFDGDRAGETFENAPIDSTVLVRQLRNKVNGDPVLGRVFKDEDNRSAWTLAEPTDEDFKIAEAAEEKSSKAPF